MIDVLTKSPSLHAIEKAIHEGKCILVEELWNAPKAAFLALAQKTAGKHLLILTGESVEELGLTLDFPLFTERKIIDFPSWEALPTEEIPPSSDTTGERYQALSQLVQSSEPCIVISSLQAALQKLLSPKNFNHLKLEFIKGEELPFELLPETLEEMGYSQKPLCTDKGEFAVRGGIVDIFPINSPDPIRVEFWGDTIESIRTFDPIGQKSIERIENKMVTAAKELELLSKEKEPATLLDYLGENTLVVFDDLLALEDKWANISSMLAKPTPLFQTLEDFLKQAEKLQQILFTKEPVQELAEIRVLNRKDPHLHEIAFESMQHPFKVYRAKNPFSPVAPFLLPESEEEVSPEEMLMALGKLEQFHLTFLCENNIEEESLKKKLQNISLPEKTAFKKGYLSSSFVLPDAKELIFSITELSGKTKIRRQKLRSTYHSPPTEVFDIAPGEMVVHLQNGIGRFLGIEKKPNHLGVESEFFQIEYAEGGKLFVPIKDAYLISKYIGANETIPKMHTLGSNRWKNLKEKTEVAILGYAKDLLELYAKREIAGGHKCNPDSDLLNSFEETFPFVETEDQLMAIDAIKQEMQSEKAMDRLVCGDVGYGKTEVAMRAAFKAVVDGGKQVAVLVPTTVLAMQHYESFAERMQHFPLEIACLSRFRPQKEIKENLEKIKKGTVDIVIGTHRLISKDVSFKNLGLIIIDEEQRFGVRAKEHLKKIKAGVDCLTLSATPIPRTLYMSLIGARDLSLINTPPQDRLPIKTIITEPNANLLKNALMRELSRDGQAYVIHNRVETIYSMADQIQKLLPFAKIAVGHGQMSADELDKVFHAFKSGKADILIATSIVENGIDIPNANTILIDKADHFGLADLYQLRGRVGRWNRASYCYFLIKNMHTLPELTRKRLQALAESSGYGGGMRLAMRDLEIRGAGDIIGTEQSGHVASIGFTLYCKLLKRTIKALQGKLPANLIDTKVDLPIDARLPEEYVNAANLRMEFYQRFGEATSFEETTEIFAELADRFGPPPKPAIRLHTLARIRIRASELGYTLVKVEKLSLITERKVGKDKRTSRVLFKIPDDPEELEKILFDRLS